MTGVLVLPAWRPSRAAALPVALGLAAGTLATIASERMAKHAPPMFVARGSSPDSQSAGFAVRPTLTVRASW